MKEIRYVHAADLHLDAPFQGLCKPVRSGDGALPAMREATFSALSRLVNLCLNRKPDFLVIAGDVYNGEDKSVKAQLALRDACARLDEEGIPVFIVHGNHDPLSSRFAAVSWPKNTTIFGAELSAATVTKNGEQIALITGVSHASDKEARNLAAEFRRDPDFAGFQLGLLHCSVESGEGGEKYAPCALSDLINSGLDAWALGHVHQPMTLNKKPFIAYSGSVQGLHVNETGARGCYEVVARATNDGWNCEYRFVQLAGAYWEKLAVSLEGVETVDECEKLMFAAAEKLRVSGAPEVNLFLVRVVFQGRTVLDGALRDPALIADLLERSRRLGLSRPAVWIKDIKVETSGATTIEETAERDDLLGETARVLTRALADRKIFEEIISVSLEPMLSNYLFKKSGFKFSEEETRDALREAGFVCRKELESR